jgi:hypothetical protein
VDASGSAEILRLRNNYHALQKIVMGLTYRVEELERLEPAINEVLLAQRVAAGLKQALKEDSDALKEAASDRFTTWQKTGIGIGAGIALVDFLMQIVHAWPS